MGQFRQEVRRFCPMLILYKGKRKNSCSRQNGAGKTTLLRLLAGELTPDRDDSRGSYGRSNDMVTGAATAGSDLEGTAKRAQRAKKKKPSGNPETGITMSRNITIDMLRQADKSNRFDSRADTA